MSSRLWKSLRLNYVELWVYSNMCRLVKKDTVSNRLLERVRCSGTDVKFLRGYYRDFCEWTESRSEMQIEVLQVVINKVLNWVMCKIFCFPK